MPCSSYSYQGGKLESKNHRDPLVKSMGSGDGVHVVCKVNSECEKGACVYNCAIVLEHMYVCLYMIHMHEHKRAHAHACTFTHALMT